MTNQGKTPSLEIEVKDFGPIVHGKVDLRPMTVLIGPSNTGKSYLAILLYALHRFFGSDDGRMPGFGRFGPAFGRGRPSISQETAVALAQLVQELAGSETGSDEQRKIALTGEVLESLRSEFDKLGNAASTTILRCFGLSDASTLVRKGRRTRASVAIRRSLPGGEKALAHALLIGAQRTEVQFTIPEELSVQDISRNDLSFALGRIGAMANISDGDIGPYEYWIMISQLMEWLVPGMVGSLHLPAYYLPADRTGVMHAHSAVVSAMLGSAPMAGIEPTVRTPMLPGVLADFLRQLIEIDMVPHRQSLSRRQRTRQDISTEIENTVIGGTVRVDRSEFINYPHFTYRPAGWQNDLPLMNASSMVSELAPVVLYLRHVMRPGNVLIIEEPEAHLHPAMQVEFTRQLAKLVQHGYRVIITTHSEWVLEELGNIVQRSQLPEKDRAAVSESDAALPPEQVGVWLFRPQSRPRGSEIVEVKMGDAGLYDTGFDDVAIALSNDGANIFDRIRESR